MAYTVAQLPALKTMLFNTEMDLYLAVRYANRFVYKANILDHYRHQVKVLQGRVNHLEQVINRLQSNNVRTVKVAYSTIEPARYSNKFMYERSKVN